MIPKHLFVYFIGTPTRFQFVHFRKGTKGPKLVLDGFSYFKNNGNPNRTYWLCSRNRYGKCKARIITMNSTREVIIKNQNHNHEPEPANEIESLDLMTFDMAMQFLKECEK